MTIAGMVGEILCPDRTMLPRPDRYAILRSRPSISTVALDPTPHLVRFSLGSALFRIETEKIGRSRPASASRIWTFRGQRPIPKARNAFGHSEARGRFSRRVMHSHYSYSHGRPLVVKRPLSARMPSRNGGQSEKVQKRAMALCGIDRLIDLLIDLFRAWRWPCESLKTHFWSEFPVRPPTFQELNFAESARKGTESSQFRTCTR